MYKALFTILFAQIVFGQAPDGICATPPMPVEQVMEIKRAIENTSSDRYRNSEAVHVLVAWHEIQTESGLGYNSIDAINSCIEALNDDYLEHNIFFTLDTVNRAVSYTHLTLPTKA